MVAEALALAVGAWNYSMSYSPSGCRVDGENFALLEVFWWKYHLAGDVSLTVIVR